MERKSSGVRRHERQVKQQLRSGGAITFESLEKEFSRAAVEHDRLVEEITRLNAFPCEAHKRYSLAELEVKLIWIKFCLGRINAEQRFSQLAEILERDEALESYLLSRVPGENFNRMIFIKNQVISPVTHRLHVR